MPGSFSSVGFDGRGIGSIVLQTFSTIRHSRIKRKRIVGLFQNGFQDSACHPEKVRGRTRYFIIAGW